MKIILIICFSALVIFQFSINVYADAIDQHALNKLKDKYKKMFPDASFENAKSEVLKIRKITAKEKLQMKEAITGLRAVIHKYPEKKAWCAMLQCQVADIHKDLSKYEQALKEYQTVLDEYADQKSACESAREGMAACKTLMEKAEISGKESEEKAEISEDNEKIFPKEEKVVYDEPKHIIYLNNGREIRGDIISETGDTITIGFSGNTIVFEKTEIKTIKEIKRE